MDINKYHFDIAALVGKYMADELDEREKAELDRWLRQSESNRVWFGKVTSESYRARKLEILSGFDVDRGWSSLQSKRSGKGKRVLLLKWMKYAAILAVPVMLAISIWFLGDKPATREILAENIQPGYRQATLVLSNGNAVALNETKEKQLTEKSGAVIELADEHLNYEQKETATELIYNTLVVPRGGEYSITLSDGTQVFLNADSKLKFPVNFAKGHREVELQGEAYFKVAHNSDSPFTVKANGMDVRVLGTEFNISAYPDDSFIRTTLVNGSVQATAAVTGSTVILKPGQEAELAANRKSIAVSDVDVSFATSWKNGQLRFKEKPLGEIMTIISRWYNVNVVYEDESLKNYAFGCNFSRYTTIEPLLKVFEATGTIQISLTDDNTIHISKHSD